MNCKDRRFVRECFGGDVGWFYGSIVFFLVDFIIIGLMGIIVYMLCERNYLSYGIILFMFDFLSILYDYWKNMEAALRKTIIKLQ